MFGFEAEFDSMFSDVWPQRVPEAGFTFIHLYQQFLG